MPEVVNLKKDSYDVYIGRGSRWGNPFHIGKDGTREDVIQKYRIWLWREIKAGRITKEDLKALRGKRLGCFCKPEACHGDVLVAATEWALRY